MKIYLLLILLPLPFIFALIIIYNRFVKPGLQKKFSVSNKYIDIAAFLISIFLPIIITFYTILTIRGVEGISRVIWGPDMVWCIERSSDDGYLARDLMFYNIHAVDIQTGKFLFHRNAGTIFKFYGWQGDAGWYRAYKGIFAVDKSGSFRTEIRLDRLEKIYSSGVAEYKLDPEKFLLKVNTKDGNQHLLDPTTLKQIEGDISAAESNVKISYELKNTSPANINFLLSSGKRKKLTDISGSVLNNTIEFIDGKIIHIIEDREILIILSYETIDQLFFRLHALSFDGRELWNISKDNIKIRNILSAEKTPFYGSRIYHDRMLAAAGAYVFALDIGSGNIIWKTKL